MNKKNKKGKYLINLLLVTVLIISVLTAVVVLNKIESLKFLPETITGYGTSGQVNLTISQNLSINVLVLNMSFGSGFVTTDTIGANLTSVVSAPLTAPANWTNTSLYYPRTMEIRNEGNVNASVTLTGSAAANAFIGGTNPVFKFNGSNMETASGTSCVEGDTLAGWTDVTTGAQALCTNLGANDNRDDLYVFVQLWVPYDTVGDKEAFFTFGATAVT